MAISDKQIVDWFLANPGADDATIAKTMGQFRLTPADIARATGANLENVQSRYDAVAPTINTLENNVNSTDSNTDLNELAGIILAGDSWLSGDEKTNIANNAFGSNVTNTAIGGQKTSDVLNQLNQFESNGGTFAPGSTVVLSLGGNDLATGVDKNTITNNLNEIVSRLGGKGVKVILSGAPNASSYDDAISRTNLEMDDLYKDVAKNNKNVTVVDAMSGFLNQKDLMDESGFHLKDDSSKSDFMNQLAGAYNNSNLSDNSTKSSGDTTKALDKLTQQILGQGTTSKWSGEGLGSAEANAKDMAKILADIGITDINQFGKITSKADAVVQPVYGQGDLVQDSEGQSFYSQKIIGYVDQNGNPVDPSLVTSDVQYSGGDAGTAETIYKAPVGTQEAFGNKLTGQTVANTYGERQMGNMFGGTYSGKGNTGYGVQFDDKGNPLFYTQGASSSDIGDIAPLLTVASFIPGLAPFAQGINALMAAKSGNGLGALAGLAGLGGFSDVANAANFANAAKNKDVLGMIMSGANVAGVDNIGDYSIKDIGQTANTIKAIQSGDSNALLNAALGYASNVNNNQSVDDSINLNTNVPVDNSTNVNNTPSIETYPETSDDLTSILAGKPDNSSIAAPTDMQSLLDILGDSSNKIISDAPFVAQPTTQTTQTTQTTPDYSNQTFGSAFSAARANGESVFNWNGKAYNTNLASPEAGTQVSTTPTTQTNTTKKTVPPVSDVYPDIKGTAADKAKTTQTTSDNLGPYIGYKNAFGMTPQMGDINQVADPRTLALAKGFIGDYTLDKGFSALHPDIEGIKNAGDVGTSLGVGAQLAPLVGPISKLLGSSFKTLGSAAAADESLVSLLGRNANKDYMAANLDQYATEPARFGPNSPVWSSFVDDAAKNSGTTSAELNQLLQKANDAAKSGNAAESYRIMQNDPYTRNLMLDFSKNIGFQEVGPAKATRSFFAGPDVNPLAQYQTNPGSYPQFMTNLKGEFVSNPNYRQPYGWGLPSALERAQTPTLGHGWYNDVKSQPRPERMIGEKADGGLISSNNMDELLKIING